MPSPLDLLKENVAYFFVVVGVVWLGVTFFAGSYLLLWPTATCLVAGGLFKALPGRRVTWAWGVSTAVLGLLVGVDQIHAWYPYIGGAFTALAGEAMGVFGALLVVHALLLYLGWARPNGPKPSQT